MGTGQGRCKHEQRPNTILVVVIMMMTEEHKQYKNERMHTIFYFNKIMISEATLPSFTGGVPITLYAKE